MEDIIGSNDADKGKLQLIKVLNFVTDMHIGPTKRTWKIKSTQDTYQEIGRDRSELHNLDKLSSHEEDVQKQECKHQSQWATRWTKGYQR